MGATVAAAQQSFNGPYRNVRISMTDDERSHPKPLSLALPLSELLETTRKALLLRGARGTPSSPEFARKAIPDRRPESVSGAGQ